MHEPGCTPVRPRERHPFFWLTLVLGAFIFAFHVFAVRALLRHGGSDRYLGWAAEERPEGAVLVSAVDPEGPAGGYLLRGDRLIALDDQPLVRGALGLQLRSLLASPSYTVAFSRVAETRRAQILVALRPAASPLRLKLSVLPTTAAFAIAGVLLGLVRPGDRAVQRYVLAALGMSAGYLAFSLPFDSLSRLERLGGMLVLAGLQPAAAIGYHFFLEFPARVRAPFWSRLGVLLGVGGATLGLSRILFAIVFFLGPSCALAPALQRMGPSLLALDFFYSMLVVTAVLGIVLWKRRALADPDQRRRVDSILLGTVVAFGPLFVVATIGLLAKLAGPAGGFGRDPSWYLNLIVAARVPQFTHCLAVLYAVLKHRVFDIRLVVRRSLRYAFTKNALRALLIAPGALLIYAIISEPDETPRQLVRANHWYPLLMAGSAIALLFRRRVLTWLDRRFFREAYDRERTLLRLITEVRAADTMSDACRLAVSHLDGTLHPQAIHIFVRDRPGHEYQLEDSSRPAAAPGAIAGGDDLVRFAAATPGAREIPPEAFRPEHPGLGVHLVVPMRTGAGELAGLLLLGEARSEEPYTREDRILLDALGAQLATLFEVIQLRTKVAEEAMTRHEVLARLDARNLDLLRECPVCGACAGASEEKCRWDGSALALTVPVERTIGGRYRLDRAIGKGGMGAVYAAKDLRLDRNVALKVISIAGWQGLDPLGRFEREARALARLRHPNVVALFDYGPVTVGGAYLVMELLTGYTLRKRLESTGPPEPSLLGLWFSQIFEGVAAAHAAGVIHRDLKPENVFISTDAAGRDAVKILDFGVAKLRATSMVKCSGITLNGAVVGTRAYMSPEQLEGQTVDERADVFSLGLMLLECLTGRRPFNLREALPSVPGRDGAETRRFEAALARCLARDPAARFGSVGAMARDITPLIPSWPGPCEHGASGEAGSAGRTSTV